MKFASAEHLAHTLIHIFNPAVYEASGLRCPRYTVGIIHQGNELTRNSPGNLQTSETRVTASVLKQDPNTKEVQKNAIY